MDVDYDCAAAKKSQASGAAVPSGQAQGGESDKSTGVSTRRSSNTAPGCTTSKAGQASNVKDVPPGTSTVSTNAEANASPLPATSKKRKTPGGTSAASQNAGPVGSHGGSRRGPTAVSSARSRETNMLTFEDSQGYLKDGKLKADDGTILGIDGEWPETAMDSKIPVYPGIC
jgi:hypothetical protein